MIDRSLLAERGYVGHVAELVAGKLENVNPMFFEAINNWLTRGVETDFEVAGITLSSLMREYRMKYPAAILTMDWLLRDPEKAKEALREGIR